MKLLLALIVLPQIAFHLAQAIGIVPRGEAGYAAATAFAMLQGVALIPAAVVVWRRVSNTPQKYISLKSISIIDYVLVGMLLLFVALGFISRHGN